MNYIKVNNDVISDGICMVNYSVGVHGQLLPLHIDNIHTKYKLENVIILYHDLRKNAYF